MTKAYASTQETKPKPLKSPTKTRKKNEQKVLFPLAHMILGVVRWISVTAVHRIIQDDIIPLHGREHARSLAGHVAHHVRCVVLRGLDLMGVLQHLLVEEQVKLSRAHGRQLAQQDVLRDTAQVVRLGVHRSLKQNLHRLFERSPAKEMLGLRTKRREGHPLSTR